MIWTADLPGLSVELATAAFDQELTSWGGRREDDDHGFVLPVQAGLRRGFVRARVAVERLGADGARIELRQTEEDLTVHVPSVVILLLGALGGLALVFWPFAPGLSPMIPFAVLVSLGAWFVVSSRIGQVGLAEFARALESHRPQS